MSFFRPPNAPAPSVDDDIFAPHGGFEGWAEAYRQEHAGQYPWQNPNEGLEAALHNLQWSQGFQNEFGRGPSDREWQMHYYGWKKKDYPIRSLSEKEELTLYEVGSRLDPAFFGEPWTPEPQQPFEPYPQLGQRQPGVAISPWMREAQQQKIVGRAPYVPAEPYAPTMPMAPGGPATGPIPGQAEAQVVGAELTQGLPPAPPEVRTELEQQAEYFRQAQRPRWAPTKPPLPPTWGEAPPRPSVPEGGTALEQMMGIETGGGWNWSTAATQQIQQRVTELMQTEQGKRVLNVLPEAIKWGYKEIGGIATPEDAALTAALAIIPGGLVFSPVVAKQRGRVGGLVDAATGLVQYIPGTMGVKDWITGLPPASVIGNALYGPKVPEGTYPTFEEPRPRGNINKMLWYIGKTAQAPAMWMEGGLVLGGQGYDLQDGKYVIMSDTGTPLGKALEAVEGVATLSTPIGPVATSLAEIYGMRGAFKTQMNYDDYMKKFGEPDSDAVIEYKSIPRILQEGTPEEKTELRLWWDIGQRLGHSQAWEQTKAMITGEPMRDILGESYGRIAAGEPAMEVITELTAPGAELIGQLAIDPINLLDAWTSSYVDTRAMNKAIKQTFEPVTQRTAMAYIDRIPGATGKSVQWMAKQLEKVIGLTPKTKSRQAANYSESLLLQFMELGGEGPNAPDRVMEVMQLWKKAPGEAYTETGMKTLASRRSWELHKILSKDGGAIDGLLDIMKEAPIDQREVALLNNWDWVVKGYTDAYYGVKESPEWVQGYDRYMNGSRKLMAEMNIFTVPAPTERNILNNTGVAIIDVGPQALIPDPELAVKWIEEAGVLGGGELKDIGKGLGWSEGVLDETGGVVPWSGNLKKFFTGAESRQRLGITVTTAKQFNETKGVVGKGKALRPMSDDLTGALAELPDGDMIMRNLINIANTTHNPDMIKPNAQKLLGGQALFESYIGKPSYFPDDTIIREVGEFVERGDQAGALSRIDEHLVWLRNSYAEEAGVSPDLLKAFLQDADEYTRNLIDGDIDYAAARLAKEVKINGKYLPESVWKNLLHSERWGQAISYKIAESHYDDFKIFFTTEGQENTDNVKKATELWTEIGKQVDTAFDETIKAIKKYPNLRERLWGTFRQRQTGIRGEFVDELNEMAEGANYVTGEWRHNIHQDEAFWRTLMQHKELEAARGRLISDWDQLYKLDRTQISPETLALLDDWLEQMRVDKLASNYVSLQYGKARADFSLHDYDAERGFDRWLRFYSPFPIWASRTVVKTPIRYATHPSWIAAEIKYGQFKKNILDQSMRPGRFEQKWFGTDTPLAGDIVQGLFWDVLPALDPLDTFRSVTWEDDQSIEQYNSEAGELFGYADRALQFSGVRAWPWWDFLLVKNGLRKAEDMGSWSTWTDLVQTITRSFLDPQDMKGIYKFLPPMLKPMAEQIGGINIEAPIRQWAELPINPPWELYTTSRQAGIMASEAVLAGDMDTAIEIAEAFSSTIGEDGDLTPILQSQHPHMIEAMNRANGEIASRKFVSMITSFRMQPYYKGEDGRRWFLKNRKEILGELPWWKQDEETQEKYFAFMEENPDALMWQMVYNPEEAKLIMQDYSYSKAVGELSENMKVRKEAAYRTGSDEEISSFYEDQGVAYDALDEKFPLAGQRKAERLAQQREVDVKGMYGDIAAHLSTLEKDTKKGFYADWDNKVMEIPAVQEALTRMESAGVYRPEAEQTLKALVKKSAVEQHNRGNDTPSEALQKSYDEVFWEREPLIRQGKEFNLQHLALERARENYPDMDDKALLKAYKVVTWPTEEEMYGGPSIASELWDTWNDRLPPGDVRKQIINDIPILETILDPITRKTVTDEQYAMAVEAIDSWLLENPDAIQGTPEEWAIAKEERELLDSILSKGDYSPANIQTMYAEKDAGIISDEMQDYWALLEEFKLAHPIYTKYYDPDFGVAEAKAFPALAKLTPKEKLQAKRERNEWGALVEATFGVTEDEMWDKVKLWSDAREVWNMPMPREVQEFFDLQAKFILTHPVYTKAYKSDYIVWGKFASGEEADKYWGEDKQFRRGLWARKPKKKGGWVPPVKIESLRAARLKKLGKIHIPKSTWKPIPWQSFRPGRI